jgi:hypothetical protein
MTGIVVATGYLVSTIDTSRRLILTSGSSQSEVSEVDYRSKSYIQYICQELGVTSIVYKSYIS